MSEKYSLREMKHARTKIALMNAFIERLQALRFDDISVQDICKKVEISEGTFFNYFPEKVDLINYYRHLFFTKIVWMAKQDVPEGHYLELINTAFKKMGDESEKQNINMVHQIISVMIVQTKKPKAVHISDVEKRLAFPDCKGIEKIPSVFIDVFFRQCLERAEESGELPKNTKIDDLQISLLTIMSGTLLAAKLQNVKNRKYHYMRQLQLLWKGLGVRLAALLLFLVSVLCPMPGHAEVFSNRSAPGKARMITISDGIDMVLRDSRVVKIELAGEDISFADTVAAISPLLPHLSSGVSKSFNNFTPEMKFGPTTVAMGDKDHVDWGVDIYQTIFDFGKSISSYRAASEIYNSHKASVETAKRAVTLEFIYAYFTLLESEKMVLVLEKEAESLTSYLNDMDHLYEQGVIVKNDLLAAKVKLADAKQRLIASRNQREVLAAHLSTLLTLPLAGDITVQDVKMDIPSLRALEEEWGSAERMRPEIRFYNTQIKASSLREDARSVENLPTIFLDGGYSYAENKFMVHEDDTYIKLGAKMNLYDGGLSGAEVSKERDTKKMLKEEKAKILEDIRYEVKESFLSLTNAIEKVSVAKDALAQAEENVRFYRVKYNNGAATSTEVLEAITLETRAETNYYSADYELKRSYAKLTYSAGNDLASIYKKTEK
ncbi:MAG: TolC family protein [Candidatus Omnitrophica bacterium]|nr:TolC family protein [Candidatus Omnitrophota bacterium]